MMKNNNSSTIIILLSIIAILLIIILLLCVNNNKIEKFGPDNDTIVIPKQITQYGSGPVDSSGTIKFKSTFLIKPVIFTQIIGNKEKSDNSYIIQVFNVTVDGFDYSKNALINSKGNGFSVLKMDNSKDEPFYWIAYSSNSSL